MAHLPQQVNGSRRRYRTMLSNEPVEIESVQQFHHVVERTVGRDAEVEQIHRVR